MALEREGVEAAYIERPDNRSGLLEARRSPTLHLAESTQMRGLLFLREINMGGLWLVLKLPRQWWLLYDPPGAKFSQTPELHASSLGITMPNFMSPNGVNQ